MGLGNLVWALAGLFVGILSCILIILAFATPYWIVSQAGFESATQLRRLGLWEICFIGYSDVRDSFGRLYNGCWWIFAREYDAIRPLIIKDWFATTQALMTVNLLLTLMCILLGIMLLLKCLPSNAQKYAALVCSLSNYLIAILTAAGCVNFGVHTDTDQMWLKQPKLRVLSWSFYCAIIGGIISLFSAMFYTVCYMKIRKGFVQSTAYIAREVSYKRDYRRCNT